MRKRRSVSKVMAAYETARRESQTGAAAFRSLVATAQRHPRGRKARDCSREKGRLLREKGSGRQLCSPVRTRDEETPSSRDCGPGLHVNRSTLKHSMRLPHSVPYRASCDFRAEPVAQFSYFFFFSSSWGRLFNSMSNSPEPSPEPSKAYATRCNLNVTEVAI